LTRPLDEKTKVKKFRATVPLRETGIRLLGIVKDGRQAQENSVILLILLAAWFQPVCCRQGQTEVDAIRYLITDEHTIHEAFRFVEGLPEIVRVILKFHQSPGIFFPITVFVLKTLNAIEWEVPVAVHSGHGKYFVHLF
jgi:hypothetical protein